MSPWLVSMKSPANRGADHGTTSFESGSVRPSLTRFQACGPLAAVAMDSSENSAWMYATCPGLRVTEYTAG